jgi:hypothetical protein
LTEISEEGAAEIISSGRPRRRWKSFKRLDTETGNNGTSTLVDQFFGVFVSWFLIPIALGLRRC